MEGWCGMAGWYEVHTCVREGGGGEGKERRGFEGIEHDMLMLMPMLLSSACGSWKDGFQGDGREKSYAMLRRCRAG